MKVLYIKESNHDIFMNLICMFLRKKTKKVSFKHHDTFF